MLIIKFIRIFSRIVLDNMNDRSDKNDRSR